MNRLIQPPSGYYTRCLREEYVAICDGHLCAAMILSQHEYWHQHNLLQRKKAQHQNMMARQHGEAGRQNTSLWVSMSHEEMQAELFGLFGERKIGDAYKFLLSKGFLHSRANPRQSWDRKPQYLFLPEAVQVAVSALPPRSVNEDAEIDDSPNAAPRNSDPRNSAASTPQNCGEEAAILRSQPLHSAETTPQNDGDSLKNISQNKKRISERAASPPGVSLALSEEETGQAASAPTEAPAPQRNPLRAVLESADSEFARGWRRRKGLPEPSRPESPA